MTVEGTALSTLLYTCQLHSHSCWEIILNIQGNGREMIGDQQMDFYPGSITLCAPNTSHTKFCDESGKPWQDIYLRFFDPESLFHPRSCRLEDNGSKTMETMLRAMQSLYYGGQHAAADHLCNAICALALDWDTPDQPSQITQQLIHEMAQHMADPEFTVKSAIAQSGYCSDYVRRIFRRDTGMTPTAYLNRIRVVHAQSLLNQQQKPMLSVHDIALWSGFYDANYFCQVFKKITGLSPEGYRNGKK